MSYYSSSSSDDYWEEESSDGGDDLYEYINNTNRRSKVYCTLCKVFLSHNDYNISVHNSGNTHLRLRAEDYMKSNVIFYVTNNEDELFCKICNVFFSYDVYDDLYDHINKHIEWFDDMKGLIDGEDINIDEYCENLSQDKAYCGKCDVWVPCNYDNLEQHINGNTHSRLKAEEYRKNNAIFHVINDEDQLFCKICNIFFPYDVYDDLYDHINHNNEHSEWFDDINGLIDGEDINIDEYCENLSQYKAYCSRCDVWIPCNYRNLEEHINGNKHCG